MSQRRAVLESNLIGETIRRFKTCSDEDNFDKISVRILFTDDQTVYWLMPLHGHVFESVWVNTGKSHDEVTRVSQEYINKNMVRVKLHCTTHVLAMIDIKREDGNAPSTYALEVHEEF